MGLLWLTAALNSGTVVHYQFTLCMLSCEVFPNFTSLISNQFYTVGTINISLLVKTE